jgi:hypothetical protein
MQKAAREAAFEFGSDFLSVVIPAEAGMTAES